MRSGLLTVALAASLAACGGGAVPPAVAKVRGPTAIRYDVALRSADPWVLDVRATFEGGVASGAIAFPPALAGLVVEERGEQRTPEAHGRSWQLDCAATCSVRYSFDLSRAAELTGDAASVAVRSGGDVLAPASVWLLRAEPVDGRVKVALHVDTRDPAAPSAEPLRFAAPFPRDPASGEHQLVARDVPALGYTVWGKFKAFSVAASRGTVDVAVLGGARAADDAAIERWVSATARALDTVYGRFPIDHVLLAIVPSPGSDQVDFGRTVPAGGASIVVYAGERAGEAALMDDWVLAHEMFHLGVPSMARDGRWIDEGLATYYEPVLRTRAGLRTERATWVEFGANMPRGVATEAEPSLSRTEDHDRIYFGGSLFSLAADVEIRRRTAGKKSLDDGLRQVLAEGGKATDVWSVADFVAALDRGTGVPVVRELFERTLPRATPCDAALLSGAASCPPDESAAFARLFERLGVRFGTYEGMTLDDTAPLAEVRRGIGRMDETIAGIIAKRAPAGVAGAASSHATAAGDKP